jgi:hypothetical protein
VPRVLERDELRVALAPRLVLEDDVVVAVGAQRRVEVDEVDRLRVDVAPQDVEVVAVVEDVGLHAYPLPRLSLAEHESRW